MNARPTIQKIPLLYEKLVWERNILAVKGNRHSFNILGWMELTAKIDLLYETGEC